MARVFVAPWGAETHISMVFLWRVGGGFTEPALLQVLGGLGSVKCVALPVSLLVVRVGEEQGQFVRVW